MGTAIQQLRQLMREISGREEALRGRFKNGPHDAKFFADASALLTLALAAERELGVTSSDVEDPLVALILLKARNICAESLDLRGDLTGAARALDEGPQIGGILSKGLHEADPKLQRERIRYYSNWCRVCLYAAGKLDLAATELSRCLDYVDEVTAKSREKCHGTRGMILYYLACTLRKVGRLDESAVQYGKAIDEFRRRADFVSNTEDGEKRQIELQAARHDIAVILGLGLGWVYSQRGNLQQALDCAISPAQVILADSHDELHRSYLDVIRCSNVRARLGRSNPERIRETMKLVESAYKTFSSAPYCHGVYAARAAQELVLCCHSIDQIDQSREWLLRLQEHAPKTSQWAATLQWITSRTERLAGNGGLALEAAERAKRLAEDASEGLTSLDASIGYAEALLFLKRTDEAITELKLALERVNVKGRQNAKIKAVIHVQLASAYCTISHFEKAETHLASWRLLKDSVEHAFPEELASSVERRVKASTIDFVVRWEQTETHDYEIQHSLLRLWLLRRAHQAGERKEETAARIGVTMPTLRSWTRKEKEWQRLADTLSPSRAHPSQND